jgi:hypothetical protein
MQRVVGLSRLFHSFHQRREANIHPVSFISSGLATYYFCYVYKSFLNKCVIRCADKEEESDGHHELLAIKWIQVVEGTEYID